MIVSAQPKLFRFPFAVLPSPPGAAAGWDMSPVLNSGTPETGLTAVPVNAQRPLAATGAEIRKILNKHSMCQLKDFGKIGK